MLVGLIPSPGNYNPFANPERAKARRNLVLQVMHEQGYITAEDLEKAKAELLPEKAPAAQGDKPGLYFIEHIRRILEPKYGTETLWKGGLNIYTTIDIDQQTVAEEIMNRKLLEFDAVIAAHSHKEHPGSIVAKKIAVQPGPFGESAALLRFYFDDKTGKLVEIKSELLRKRTNQNQKILEICSRAKQKSLTAAREKLGDFSRSSEFGNFCAGKIREYFKCDAAFFSMNEKFFIPGTMTGKKLFKLMPYGNRICMVKGDGKDFEKLMKKLSTPWRQIYFSGNLVGNDICVAMSDHLFLLYQNIDKNKVYDAEMTGVFEREVIRQALKKEFNKNILE